MVIFIQKNWNKIIWCICNKNLKYWLEGCVTFFKVFGSVGGEEYGSGEGEFKVLQFIYNILFIMCKNPQKWIGLRILQCL